MATSLGAVGSALLHFENLRSRTQVMNCVTGQIRVAIRSMHCIIFCCCFGRRRWNWTPPTFDCCRSCSTSNWSRSAPPAGNSVRPRSAWPSGFRWTSRPTGSTTSRPSFRVTVHLPLAFLSSCCRSTMNGFSSSTEAIAANKSRAGEVQAELAARTEAMRGDGNAELRAVLTAHHQLISDVRSALKAMAKGEPETPAGPLGPVGRYLETYGPSDHFCFFCFSHWCRSSSSRISICQALKAK